MVTSDALIDMSFGVLFKLLRYETIIFIVTTLLKYKRNKGVVLGSLNLIGATLFVIVGLALFAVAVFLGTMLVITLFKF